MDIARQTLLEFGLAGTTMGEVARRAGISKASLYREHPAKDAMFSAVVLDWTARGRDAMRPALDALLAAEDIVEGLLEFVRTLQAAVLDEDVARMRQLVVGESDRLPHVAAAYLSGSWERNIAALADALAELDSRGTLTIDDSTVAAEQLTWLAVGGSLNRQILGVGRLSARELERIADEAVTTIVHRYRPGAT